MHVAETIRLSWRSWLTLDHGGHSRWWMSAAWTFAFCAVVAIGFTAVSMLLGRGHGDPTAWRDWWAWYRANLVVSLCVGFAVRIAFVLSAGAIGRERLARAAPWQRTVYFLVVPVLGVAVGWPLGLAWGVGVDVRTLFHTGRPGLLAGTIIVVLLTTALFQQFFWSRARQIAAEDRASAAQLRLLQAQIEPHFLFNTLANVVSLIDADAPRAKAMLEAFVDYLRASLVVLRDDTHTLGDEVALVDAYMQILKIRMADRLEYAIDVPEALRGASMPVLTLQPLVENAIVHGLEPQLRGGRVHVRAERDGQNLVVTVDDDGGGLAEAARPAAQRGGSGTAVANIRRRLAQTFGERASLEIAAGRERGVRARLSLPLAP